eukprot:GFUD01029716.1.p1 GENE.GFUD01029716.1~~GFUD01029716.1.p1  ORF type:complete len:104 (+),score=11.05 GFUD01029716.1:67-378(+)
MQLLPVLLFALLTLLPHFKAARQYTYVKDGYKFTVKKEPIKTVSCWFDSDCKGIWAYGQCVRRKCQKSCQFDFDCPRSYDNCNSGKCCNHWEHHFRKSEIKCI